MIDECRLKSSILFVIHLEVCNAWSLPLQIGTCDYMALSPALTIISPRQAASRSAIWYDCRESLLLAGSIAWLWLDWGTRQIMNVGTPVQREL